MGSSWVVSTGERVVSTGEKRHVKRLKKRVSMEGHVEIERSKREEGSEGTFQVKRKRGITFKEITPVHSYGCAAFPDVWAG